jgi:hypothetical protein
MDYQIRGRIIPVANQGYAVIAIATPSGKGPATQLGDTCPTRAQAATRLRALVVDLGAMIRRQGGEVLEVRTED